jgi:molybdopterin converting factor subunit 1
MITVEIQYYALLREQAGKSTERIETMAKTALELYREVQQRHGFSLAPDQLQVAINSDFSHWDVALENGQRIVFIPPVAGG